MSDQIDDIKYPIKRPVGHPRVFSNDPEFVNGLYEKVIEYMARDGKKSMTGLQLHIGMHSRATWMRYQKENSLVGEFARWASLIIQNYYEESGMEAKNPTMQIFILKNMGWTDRSDQVITVQNNSLEDKSEDELELILEQLREQRAAIESAD